MKQSASTPTTERALSIAQQRLWVLEQLHPGSPVQNVAMALRWTQKVDQASLERCLADLLDRHDILQTEFRIVNGTPSQIATRAPIVLKVEDVSRIPSAERTARLVSLHQSEVATAFDLTRGPLIRATLFRVAEEDHVIALVAHRIVCDANSLHL